MKYITGTKLEVTPEQIAKLTEAGFNVWDGSQYGKGMRLYIRTNFLYKKILELLEVEYYNTGNISEAFFDGVAIPNAEAARIAESKLWIETEDGSVHCITECGKRGGGSGLDENSMANDVAAYAFKVLNA